MSRRTTSRGPSSPLVSISTITYIASWRGQLLICTIVLILGAIYFVIRRPIHEYLQRRREEVSRARQLELINMSSDTQKEKEISQDGNGNGSNVAEKGKEQRERGKEKKKEQKKRKGSMLRVPTATGSGTESSTSASASVSGAGGGAGPSSSSMESSPAPDRLTPASAGIRKRSISNNSPSPSPSPSLARLPTTPERSRPQIKVREDDPELYPRLVDLNETPKSSKPKPNTRDTRRGSGSSLLELNAGNPPSPEGIPLPGSPDSGPSRLRVPASEGYISDTTSNASFSISEGQSPSKPPSKLKSDGFSIIPEDGYLPPYITTPASSSKKKKRKPRQQEKEKEKENGDIVQTSTESANSETGTKTEELPATPFRRHSRQDSLKLSRPINASSEEYEAHIDRMDGVIDRLRGELGASLAGARLAREAEEEAKQREEQVKAELVKVKQKAQVVEGHKRREADLSSQLDHARRYTNKLLQRITEIERLGQLASPLPSANGNGPPPSPFLPMPMPMSMQGGGGPPSPFPMHGHFPFHANPNGNGNMSPMPPSSPYNMSFSSASPALGPRGSIHHVNGNGNGNGSMPNPQMYPSPMLHPHAHGQYMNNGLISPYPFRRTSTTTSDSGNMIQNDVFAGPLTPGLPLPGPSPSSASPAYPYDLGHGFPTPSAVGSDGPGSATGMSAEERRTSIEASVMRKKNPEGTGTEVHGPILEQEEEGGEEIDGNGDGTVGLGMGLRLTAASEGQDETQHQGWRASLSPPDQGTGTGTDNGQSSSNPPTPSPQSRLLTPSQLHQDPSGSTDEDNCSNSNSITNSAASNSGTGATKPLWGAEVTASQLKQRMHLAALRQQQRDAEAVVEAGKGEEEEVGP